MCHIFCLLKCLLILNFILFLRITLNIGVYKSQTISTVMIKKKNKGHKIMCALEATNRTYPGLKICKYAIGSICTYMYGYNNNIFMRRITIKRNDER